MSKQSVESLIIVGGGTAGWMAAAALAERYKEQALQVRVVESPEFAPVGVGEATVPGIRRFHHFLGISEQAFIKATGATFKLGIEFSDWSQLSQSFFHPFAAFGAPIAGCDFHQCWLALREQGIDHHLEDFCLSAQMARMDRFSQPDEEATSELARYNYAYHFDASLYARFLRDYALQRGVSHVEGKVTDVLTHSPHGAIKGLKLEDGRQLEADFFVDCSGFKSLLLGQTLGVPFDDWSHWLPCDRAVVVQTQNIEPLRPYTVSKALSAGWQWRIPLEHRAGNGYVYCSRFISDEQARADLLVNVTGDCLTEPRVLHFTAGMRSVFWRENCVALGLASGFIEPLESTSISLIQTGIEKLIQFMPELELSATKRDEANRLNTLEYEHIRDFIVLHYISSQRDDTEFWRWFKERPFPVTLEEKLRAFQKDGSIVLHEQESFQEASWLAMHAGFGRYPMRCSMSARALDAKKLNATFQRMRGIILEAAECAPGHREFLNGVYS